MWQGHGQVMGLFERERKPVWVLFPKSFVLSAVAKNIPQIKAPMHLSFRLSLKNKSNTGILFAREMHREEKVSIRFHYKSLSFPHPLFLSSEEHLFIFS